MHIPKLLTPKDKLSSHYNHSIFSFTLSFVAPYEFGKIIGKILNIANKIDYCAYHYMTAQIWST